MTLPDLSPDVGGQSLTTAALELADIIVSTTPAWISAGIRAATGSPVSHAMLYIGKGEVIEAVGDGVVQRPLGVALADASLAVAYRRRALSPAVAVRIRQFVRAQVGRGYDYPGILAQAGYQLDRTVLCSVSPTDACEALVQRVNLRHQDPERFFCSELVIAAYAHAGAPLTSRPAAAVSPHDVTELGQLAYVGHLRT